VRIRSGVVVSEALIRNTMRTFIKECRDPITGEINCTKLAEETACALNLYVGADIPAELFELAFKMAEEADDQQRR
jgi:hypothetical protein